MSIQYTSESRNQKGLREKHNRKSATKHKKIIHVWCKNTVRIKDKDMSTKRTTNRRVQEMLGSGLQR